MTFGEIKANVKYLNGCHQMQVLVTQRHMLFVLQKLTWLKRQTHQKHVISPNVETERAGYQKILVEIKWKYKGKSEFQSFPRQQNNNMLVKGTEDRFGSSIRKGFLIIIRAVHQWMVHPRKKWKTLLCTKPKDSGHIYWTPLPDWGWWLGNL